MEHRDRLLLALAQEDDAEMRSAFEASVEGREPQISHVLGSSLDEVRAHLQPGRDVAVLLLGMPSQVLDALLEEAQKRKTRIHWVQTTSAGADRFLTPTVCKSSVPLCRVPNVFANSLAEFTLSGFLFFAKRIPEMSKAQRRREWRRLQVRDLRGARLGVIGYGDIGQAIGRVARDGFGMRVTGLRRHPELTDTVSDVAETMLGPEGVGDLLRESDYVALATPLTPESRAMLGAEELALLQPHAVLANVGRGTLIDEVALARCLRERSFAAAVLDVFATEPLPPESPLWDLDNVLISSHTADNTADWQARAVERGMENVDRWLRGAPLLHVVDKNAGY